MSVRSRVQSMCDGEMGLLRRYITSTAAMMQGESDRLRDEVKQLSQGLDLDQAEVVEMEHAEEDQLISDIFPALSSAASFVTIYSLFEHILMIACRDLQTDNKLKISIRDLAGSGIEAAKTYLQKVCGLPFPDTSKEWQEIKNLQRIRNVIVHRRGQLDPLPPVGENKDRVIREYLEGKAPLLVCFDQIFLTDQFCLNSIDAFESFFKLLIPGLPDVPNNTFEIEYRNRHGS